MSLPVANFGNSRRYAILAAIPLTVGIVWGSYHFFAVFASYTGHGSPLALTFALSFMLLWWVPVSWREKPFQVTARQWRKLNGQTVTIQVPVYNEDPATLREALASILNQTRLPDRIHVVDDGSAVDYTEVRDEFTDRAWSLGIIPTWVRTPNRGKRWAQVEALRRDDGDIWVTLDSDSTLDRRAIEEGIKPFADPRVHSVAGMVVVWNSQANFLTRLTCMLYTPFTRGFRSAQSVLGRVMVNSGTLAFYRAETIRPYLDTYPTEEFMGRPMQMNDDSMLTFYAMMEGRTVHQPSSVSFTIVPEKAGHYLRQQLRWMRGTLVRSLWWLRYLPVNDIAWWMPVMEYLQLILGIVVIPVMVLNTPSEQAGQFAVSAVIVGACLNYLIGLRYFIIERSDEGFWSRFRIFLLAPVAGLWRILVLRPLIIYALFTFWKVNQWGTRQAVEVAAQAA